MSPENLPAEPEPGPPIRKAAIAGSADTESMALLGAGSLAIAVQRDAGRSPGDG